MSGGTTTVPSEMAPLLEVFRSYNSFGRKGDADHMDGRTFAKLCKENNLLVPPLLPTDADLLFSSVIPTPATKQINFNLFVKAIDKLADRAQGKLGTTKNVIEAIVKNGGPKSSGTNPEATRFHDDKSAYTGVHKNRPGNIDAPDKPLPSSTPSQPSIVQTQALLQRRASLRANLDKDKEVDLEELFTTYCNIGKRRDQTYKIMDSRGFQHLLRDVGVIGKGFTQVDADLVFSSVLVPGDKTCTFSQFTSALERVAQRTKDYADVDDLSARIVAQYKENGGPILTGTQAEYTRWHDDKSTFTGVHADKHGVPLEKRLSGSIKETSVSAAPAPAPVKKASSKLMGKTSSFVARSQAAIKPVPPEFLPLKAVFEAYNSFGGKKDMANMDGRTFAKFCKDQKLLVKPMLPTDCDLVFAEVLTVPGQKKIEVSALTKLHSHCCVQLRPEIRAPLARTSTVPGVHLCTGEGQRAGQGQAGVHGGHGDEHPGKRGGG